MLEGNLRFELRHKAIIDRFGRYPPRNTILGRNSTSEELTLFEWAGVFVLDLCLRLLLFQSLLAQVLGAVKVFFC